MACASGDRATPGRWLGRALRRGLVMLGGPPCKNKRPLCRRERGFRGRQGVALTGKRDPAPPAWRWRAPAGRRWQRPSASEDLILPWEGVIHNQGVSAGGWRKGKKKTRPRTRSPDNRSLRAADRPPPRSPP